MAVKPSWSHGLSHAGSQIAPVVDASSAQSRADVVVIFMSAVLLLTGLQWAALTAREALPVEPDGPEVTFYDDALPEAAVAELKWCAAAAWHGMAWHGMAWHGMAWHGMAWHGMAWHWSAAAVIAIMAAEPLHAAISTGIGVLIAHAAGTCDMRMGAYRPSTATWTPGFYKSALLIPNDMCGSASPNINMILPLRAWSAMRAATRCRALVAFRDGRCIAHAGAARCGLAAGSQTPGPFVTAKQVPACKC